jgi:hypothetical protein
MGQASKRGLIDNGVAHGRGYMGNGLAEDMGVEIYGADQ